MKSPVPQSGWLARPKAPRCRTGLALLALALSSVLLADAAPRPCSALSTEEREQLVRRAATLHEQGVRLYQQGRYAQAVVSLEQALALRRRLYPKSEYPAGHDDLAESLSDLGVARKARGDLAQARAYQEEALAMNERLYPRSRFPKGHREIARNLNNLAAVLLAQGRHGQAKGLFERALAMRRQLYPPDRYPQGHRELATSLNNLGGVLSDLGDYVGARARYEEALRMKERLYPKDSFPDGHADLALSLNNLGAVLDSLGAYAQARPYYEQALEMRRRLYPKGHPSIATSLNNLGELFRVQGEYSEAGTYLEQARAMFRSLFPPDEYPRRQHPLAVSVSNLGLLHEDMGDLAGALKYYKDSLKIERGLHPNSKSPHADLAVALNSVGRVLRLQGDYVKARPYVLEALAMRRKLFPKCEYPKGHRELVQSLDALANLLREEGGHRGAKGYYEQALAMSERLYPADQYPQGYPRLATSLSNLASLHLAMGKYDRARKGFEKALRMEEGLAGVFTAAASEAEALNFAARLPLTRDALLSATRHLPGSEEGSYHAVWRTKAALLRNLQRRQELLVKDEKTRTLLHQLNDARRRISRLLLAPPEGPGFGRQMRNAVRDKEELKRQIARTSSQVRLQGEGARSTLADLIRNLPPRTVFIDLVRYVRFEQDPRVPGRAGERRTPWYAAFVLRRGAVAARVEVGPADPINRTVTAWLAAIAGGTDDGAEGALAEKLRQQLWEPLAGQVPAGTDTVLFCPDDALTRIPWAALPCGKGGPVLLERYALAVVPHGPFLLDRLSAAASPDGKKGLLLAVGEVDYFAQPRPVRALPGQRPAATENEPSGTPGYWPLLPESGPEVTKAVELARPRTPVVRRGDEASTEQLLLDLPAARWAVLATHAFYANARFRSAFRLDEHAFGREQSGERVAAGARNPFALCGLVLAGANRPVVRDPYGVPLEDGGLITGDLIAALPLGQLDLVVLSACESRLGEVVHGEGAFSLQQAFHLAGASNVVAALWKVDDDLTAALMGLFYYKLWREGKSPLTALREAQLYLYHHKERIGDLALPWGPDFEASARAAKTGDGAEGERSPTLWWAGFNLSGPGR